MGQSTTSSWWNAAWPSRFPEDSLAARQLRQWHEEREAREAEKAWLTRHEEESAVPDGAGLDESMKEVSR